LKSQARRFLAGLSADEMQFIAEFLGSCVLESSVPTGCNRTQIAERLCRFQRPRPNNASAWSSDREHKMIVLLEYLCHAGIQPRTLAVRTAGPSVN
jgi:hypothetical protein